jgi:hypothetical protein
VLKILEGGGIPKVREGDAPMEGEGMTGAEWVKGRFEAIRKNKGIIRDEKHR